MGLVIEVKAPNQLSEEEEIEIDELARLAYAEEPDNHDLEWSWGYWKVLGRVDGKLVCLVEIIDRTCRVAGQPVRVGGVGGVATHPDHRRKGYASAAMQIAKDFMRDNLGMDYAMLYCSDHRVALYNRLGYEVIHDPVYFDQPGGKMRNLENTMALSITGKPWPQGEVDMGGLPW